ncbi:MAG: hypothetical protein R3E77_13780 [Steroidobacteraceae bacterium]
MTGMAPPAGLRTPPRRLLLVLGCAFFCSIGTAARAGEPSLLRIRAATVLAADLVQTERHYRAWLGYQVRERGRLPAAVARSLGAPRMTGLPFMLMSPDAAPDVCIRFIAMKPPGGFRPMTTWGWNSIEIIVDQPQALRGRLGAAPFEVIGEPAPLNSLPSIHAFQVKGPSREVLYLTAETGDRSKSRLPLPGGEVGRIFIMVLAGSDIDAMLGWYASTFGLQPGKVRPTPIGVVQRAQGRGADYQYPLAVMALRDPGNMLEFDGYPADTIARKAPRGRLPPGIAVTSFAVADLDAVPVTWLRPPAVLPGKLYAGARSATTRGPAGELIELIEERR